MNCVAMAMALISIVAFASPAISAVPEPVVEVRLGDGFPTAGHVALEYTGNWRNWNKLQILHPKTDEELGRDEESARRYPWGTRILIPVSMLKPESSDKTAPAAERSIAAADPSTKESVVTPASPAGPKIDKSPVVKETTPDTAMTPTTSTAPSLATGEVKKTAGPERALPQSVAERTTIIGRVKPERIKPEEEAGLPPEALAAIAAGWSLICFGLGGGVVAVYNRRRNRRGPEDRPLNPKEEQEDQAVKSSRRLVVFPTNGQTNGQMNELLQILGQRFCKELLQEWDLLLKQPAPKGDCLPIMKCSVAGIDSPAINIHVKMAQGEWAMAAQIALDAAARGAIRRMPHSGEMAIKVDGPAARVGEDPLVFSLTLRYNRGGKGAPIETKPSV